MNSKLYSHNASVLALLAFGLAFAAAPNLVSAEAYDPQIRPADFTTSISNPYLSFPIGFEAEYEGETEDGKERGVMEVTGATKNVMGVTTLIVRDRVWQDGELIEDTRDYMAQDKAGNVWYFGEDVDNYEDGALQNHDGAWLAGKGGAKPGILMKANPMAGETYREEYYPGKAEDIAEIVSLNKTVRVPFGNFTNCLQTKNWTPLEPGVIEYKYYCLGARALALETNEEGGERIELVESEVETANDDENDDEDAEEGVEDDEEEGVWDMQANSQRAAMERLIALLQQLLALLRTQR